MLKKALGFLTAFMLTVQPVQGYDGLSRLKLMEGTDMETDLYVSDSGKAGPTVVVLAGVHGDEEAGIRAAEEIAAIVPRAGRLVVVPRANRPACDGGVRAPYYMDDLNRSFPGSKDGSAAQRMAFYIVESIKAYKPAILLDLHESKERYGEAEAALGQSLVLSENGDSAGVVLNILDRINAEIGEGRRFTFTAGAPRGSANREISEGLCIPAVTVETDQNQAVQARIKQQLIVVEAVLEYYGLL